MDDAALRSTKLRVLTLLDTLRPGGAERVAVAAAARLDRRRFEPVVCVSRSGQWAPLSSAVPADVPVVTLKRPSRVAVWGWVRLLRLLRRERIDILHAHMFGSNVWGTLLGRLAGVPVVVAHEHGSSPERHPLRKFLDRELVARGADAFIAVSDADRRRMIELERLPPDKMRVVANGIPPLAPAEMDLRVALGVPATAPVLGTFGVFRPEKRLDVLMEVAARLVPEFADLRVLIAGQGREEERLRALTRELGLQERVIFAGFRRNVTDVLTALDVAVFCSDREASPLAVLEAMAAAKPIVATSVGGIPELVEDEIHALLVPPDDPDAIASRVTRLLRDPALAARLGGNAKRRQEKRFTLEATVRTLESLYEELFAASRRRRGTRVDGR